MKFLKRCTTLMQHLITVTVNIKTPITCCTSEGRPLSPRHNHISCAPITIPVTDLFYKNFFQTCMNYVRSLPAMRSDCTLGPTEQASIIEANNYFKPRTR